MRQTSPLADRGTATPRRLLVGVVVAPSIVLLTVPAAGGWSGAPGAWIAVVALMAVLGAATLATYVPAPGQRFRDAVGCSPCAAMSALAIGAAVLLVTMRPHDVAMAVLGLAVAGVALGRRRLDAAETCPAF